MEQKMIKIETTNINKARSIISRIFAVFLVISLLFCSSITCFASEYEANGVMADLMRDGNFSAEDYVENANDYSLQVIQVAESNKGELYIYTFQPAHNSIDLIASSVNIYYGFSPDGSGITPTNYSLSLVSTEGCFDKYLVNGYTVRGDEHRYYNITSIFRRVNSVIDTDVAGGTTTEKSYAVGQQWHAYWLNDRIYYEMNTFETVEITTNYTGYLQMNTDIVSNIFQSSSTGKFVQMWFIAFNLEDYIAEHIYNADLSFTSQRYKDNYRNFTFTSRTWVDENPVPETVYLSDVDSVSVESNQIIPFLKEAYTYKRIMKAQDFIKTFEEQGGEFTEEAKTHLNASQWVFAFKETPMTNSDRTEGVTIYSTETGTVIADATILRIKFMDINHKIYDLSVVNDKTTADSIADGFGDGLLQLEDSMQKLLEIVGIVLGVLLLAVLAYFVPPLMQIFSVLFKFLLDIVLWLISIPIKLIGSIFSKK